MSRLGTFERIILALACLLLIGVLWSCMGYIRPTGPGPTLYVTNEGAFPVRIYESGSYRRIATAMPGESCITWPRWVRHQQAIRLRFDSLGSAHDVTSDRIFVDTVSWELRFSANERMRRWDALTLTPAEEPCTS